MIDTAPSVARILRALEQLKATRVVLYGYKTPNHTHHWVMVAIHRALQFVLRESPGLELVWVDNTDEIDPRDLAGSVVLGNLNTDHVDWNMPITADATYVMHNHAPSALSTERYREVLGEGHCIFYEVYRGDPTSPGYEPIQGEPRCHLFSVSDANAVITWATDLLPHEIAANMQALEESPPSTKDGEVVFVGSVWRSNGPEMVALAEAAVERGLRFSQYGRVMTDAPFPRDPNIQLHPESVPVAENRRLVREALVAPAVQGGLQLPNPPEVGNFIPCRIFKNISYGAWGVTNNPSVADLFDGEIMFGEGPSEMLDAALERIATDPDRRGLLPLMERVAQRHTYLNRIGVLLDLAVERMAWVGRAPASGSVAGGPDLGLRGRRLVRRVVGWRWQ